MTECRIYHYFRNRIDCTVVCQQLPVPLHWMQCLT